MMFSEKTVFSERSGFLNPQNDSGSTLLRPATTQSRHVLWHSMWEKSKSRGFDKISAAPGAVRSMARNFPKFRCILFRCILRKLSPAFDIEQKTC